MKSTQISSFVWKMKKKNFHPLSHPLLILKATGKKHKIKVYTKIKSIRINYSDFVTKNISKTLQFSSFFIIHNILYVIEFNFNLLSISKLISNLWFKLILSNDSFIIRDVNSFRMIKKEPTCQLIFGPMTSTIMFVFQSLTSYKSLHK